MKRIALIALLLSTPAIANDKQIALIPQDAILDLSKTVLDPCTGDGRYLMRYLYHRMDAIRCVNITLPCICAPSGWAEA